MYLEKVVSKGVGYYYLRKYLVREHYTTRKIIVYKFGREEKALSNMYKWRAFASEFPKELIQLGCTSKDLENWIRYIETKIKLVV